jgi:hypothetical protein
LKLTSGGGEDTSSTSQENPDSNVHKGFSADVASLMSVLVV